MAGRFEPGTLRNEAVAVWIFCTSNWCIDWDGIDHVNRVLLAIDAGVDSQEKDVLMIMSIDACSLDQYSVLYHFITSGELTLLHLRTKTLEVFTRVHDKCIEDSGELDNRLNCAVLMEHPLWLY